ncbi:MULTISPECIES: septum formation initiator family protein [Dehalobacter]|jgi:cell division protein FtsL|uniref:Septum formation initiator n=2 Tax=Dehalobacter restrictus TaxID=55583 RepID=A0A857DKS5_9FIRM|nr:MULTISPECIES: septum formation initiator family protein [Dehalobacter]AHF10573.1 septum formation initiator [Dehalobacter restrictus DSM 9455]MCG1026458.1 septum formation initiator family protein [Dehalobacter sp.]MDJ0305958.1 septum formation initiator family protein [Dehalobacter sp.]OCZ52389.1 septum formation initiator [Dehalobacter sp. TeCB1]QHA01198.1 septum formation initiator [Dehalobacter restrictus]
MLTAQRKLQFNESFAYQEYDQIVDKGKPKAKKATPSKKTSQMLKYRAIALLVMLGIIGMFGLIGAKTVHITVVKAAEIKALQKEIQTLNVENDLLQVEVDKLSSVSRIEKVALAMGMEKPEGTIYIASSLIQPESTAEVDQTQKTAAVPDEGKANSILGNVFSIFSSFFASTQR